MTDIIAYYLHTICILLVLCICILPKTLTTFRLKTLTTLTTLRHMLSTLATLTTFTLKNLENFHTYSVWMSFSLTLWLFSYPQSYPHIHRKKLFFANIPHFAKSYPHIHTLPLLYSFFVVVVFVFACLFLSMPFKLLYLVLVCVLTSILISC